MRRFKRFVKKTQKKRRERIIRNKDIEALGLDSAKMQVNLCKKRPDRRMDDWLKERREYGFDSRETWNFNKTLFEFLYTRLKMYERVTNVDLDTCYVTCKTYCEEKDDYSMSMRSFLKHVLRDLETVLIVSEKLCFDTEAEEIGQEAGARALMALSECVFSIWW